MSPEAQNNVQVPGTAEAGIGLIGKPEGAQIRPGAWFTELSTMWPGQGLSIQIDEVLFKQRSDFQVLALAAAAGLAYQQPGPECATPPGCLRLQLQGLRQGLAAGRCAASSLQASQLHTGRTRQQKVISAGVIQVTERDEFSYQEMITHLPLCALEVALWNAAAVPQGCDP